MSNYDYRPELEELEELEEKVRTVPEKGEGEGEGERTPPC